MYKILINESGVLKLVEVPEKPTRGDVSFHTGKNLGAKLIEYEQALSAALADESKHIAFKSKSDLVYHLWQSMGDVGKKLWDDSINPKLWLESQVGQTFDLPTGYHVFFTENSSYMPVAELLKCECTGPWDCQCPDVIKRFNNLTTQPEAPVKSEGEEPPSQVLTAEEVLKKCLLKWCPEKERPDFEKDWKGRVDNDVFNAINEAMQEYSTLQTQQLQSRVKELEEALKPFSELAEACWADQRERKSDILYQYNTAKITFNDLLKAKESLKK